MTIRPGELQATTGLTGLAGRPSRGDAGSTSASALNAALGPVLDEIRAATPGYRRWLAGPRTGPESDLVAPWSEADEFGVSQLGSVSPWWMRTVAAELEQVRSEVGDVAAALGRVVAEGIGGSATAICERLVASCLDRGAEAGALSMVLCEMGEQAGAVVDTAVRRVLRVVNEVDEQAPGRGEPEHGDERFERHTEVLRTLRTEIPSALGRLAEIVRAEPVRGLEPPKKWCAGDLDCPPEPARWSPEWAGWSAGPGGWSPRPTRPSWSPEWDGWPPGPTRPVWLPEPGAGARLPDTESRRVEQDMGVRIAQLPDADRPD